MHGLLMIRNAKSKLNGRTAILNSIILDISPGGLLSLY